MKMLVGPPLPAFSTTSYLWKHPGGLHDLRGSRSSRSKDDHEVQIFDFPSKLFAEPSSSSSCFLFFSFVFSIDKPDEDKAVPDVQLAEASLPTHYCTFLSLSCIIMLQTRVVLLRGFAKMSGWFVKWKSHLLSASSTSVIIDTMLFVFPVPESMGGP